MPNVDEIHVLSENPRGRLYFVNDGLVVESKEQPGGQWDTPEVCFHTGNAGAGKISWRRPDGGRWREHMMILASQGDGITFQMDKLGDGSDGQDPDMDKMLLVHMDGATFNVPIIGASVPPPAAGGGFKMTSADGTHEMILQNNDPVHGRMLVHYDLTGNAPPQVISRLPPV